MVLLFLFFAALFLADALGNWGMFRNTKKHQTSSEKYRSYGPIERVFRIGLGAGFVGIMLLIAGAFFSRGGFRALIHPQEYTDANWVPPRPPTSSRPTPTPPRAPVSPPAPVTVKEPAPEPAPTPAGTPPPREAPPPPSRPPGDELQFWLYEDAKGETHMVDDLQKVPAAFRATARAMK